MADAVSGANRFKVNRVNSTGDNSEEGDDTEVYNIIFSYRVWLPVVNVVVSRTEGQ